MLTMKHLEKLVFKGLKEGLTREQVISNLIKQEIITEEDLKKIEEEKDNKEERILNYNKILEDKNKGIKIRDIARKWRVNPNYISQILRKTPEELGVDKKGFFKKRSWNKDKVSKEHWIKVKVEDHWLLQRWSRIMGGEVKDVIEKLVKYVSENKMEKILFSEVKKDG